MRVSRDPNKTDSLEAVLARHSSKLVHKWEGYVLHYERNFSEFRDRPVRLLEIGVQNGGSAEVWAEYFLYAEVIVGVDIEPNCGSLVYDDPRIKIIVADATSPRSEAEIFTASPEYDIIIDDGSHRSGDIIKTFCMLFPKLSHGGIYVIEDLHAGYWADYDGGLFDPFSSISFLKSLADIINYEHWGTDHSARSAIAGTLNKYSIDISTSDLEEIHSIEFCNSMCFIRKLERDYNVLGKRVIVGTRAIVNADPQNELPVYSAPVDQSHNEYSQFQNSPSEALLEIASFLGITDPADLRSTRIAHAIYKENRELRRRSERLDRTLASMEDSFSWKVTTPTRIAKRLWDYGLVNLISAVWRALVQSDKNWDANLYLKQHWIRLSPFWRKHPSLHSALFGNQMGNPDPLPEKLSLLEMSRCLLVNHPELCSDRDVAIPRIHDILRESTNREAFFGQRAHRSGLGLEIGPLHSPICKKPECDIRYLDVFSTEELKSNYKDDPNVDLDSVVDVDYVVRDGTYRGVVNEVFDYIVTSHNIEHVPCMVGFLQNLQSCLKPGGRIFMALPDKRYCFDHFKTESSIFDVLDAYDRRATAPSARDIVRHRCFKAHNESKRHWTGDHGVPNFRRKQSSHQGKLVEYLHDLRSLDHYVDTHVWILTPGSFTEIIELLNRDHLIRLELTAIHPTAVGSQEFYAVMKSNDFEA